MSISNKWMKAASDFFGNIRKSSSNLTSFARNIDVVDPTVIKMNNSTPAKQPDWSVDQITAAAELIRKTKMNISVRDFLEADHVLKFLLAERLKSFHIVGDGNNIRQDVTGMDMDIDIAS